MSVRLVVQGDDLGMCRSVNEGIEAAFRDGILTQASAMAPTPWFAEGAAIARRTGLPVGLHGTLTAEWDHLRWSPLSPGPTLRGADGTFHRSPDDAIAGIDVDEAVTELMAQAHGAALAGPALTYVDVHQAAICQPAYDAVCAAHGIPFVYPGSDHSMAWDSITHLSISPSRSADERTAWLVEYLEQLADGTHLLVTHPAVESDELAALTDRSNANYVWTVPIRRADLGALCSDDARRVVERRAIELVAIRDLG